MDHLSRRWTKEEFVARCVHQATNTWSPLNSDSDKISSNLKLLLRLIPLITVLFLGAYKLPFSNSVGLDCGMNWLPYGMWILVLTKKDKTHVLHWKADSYTGLPEIPALVVCISNLKWGFQSSITTCNYGCPLFSLECFFQGWNSSHQVNRLWW